MEKDTPEIEKLTERIAKDPKSKLFVPLAEEYKKTGDIEMAIQVLMEGLKNNPGYVTARSFLGRLLMEKGDLAGAQKELEEVIKAIPDNLLAQRKLADLYVLQGRSNDAVQRYKAALALNPGDKEVMSLLADLDAGKDISSRIPRPKSLSPTPVPAAKPQPAGPAPITPKAAPAGVSKPAAQTTPAAAVKAPSAPASTPPPKAGPSAAIPAKPAAPAPALRDEVEVVEDIVELEALEGPAAATESKGPVPAVPAEPREQPARIAGARPAEAAFDLSEPLAEPSKGAEELSASSWGAEETLAPAVSKPLTAGEGSDDLNTNTLAELYITQGFYDKAIEIYQGMLAERPGSKALQQKLDHLRALAGAQDPNAGAYTAVPGEYSPPASDIFAETEALSQPVPPVPQPAAETPVRMAPKHTEPATQKEIPEPSSEATATRSPQAATVRRKETIDRLESWLKNIMKEKEE